MRASREKRSAEHDDGGLGTGVFAAFPTRWLPGEVTGVDQSAEDWQERVLSDGSRHSVYKRWFTAAGPASETGGALLHAGPRFVAARGSSPRS